MTVELQNPSTEMDVKMLLRTLAAMPLLSFPLAYLFGPPYVKWWMA